MTPTIKFHRVVSLQLGELVHLRIQGSEFWSRDLIVTDDAGATFEVELYSDVGPAALEIPDHPLGPDPDYCTEHDEARDHGRCRSCEAQRDDEPPDGYRQGRTAT